MAKPIDPPFFLLLLALISTLFSPTAHSKEINIACGSERNFTYGGKDWVEDTNTYFLLDRSSETAQVSNPSEPLSKLRYFPSFSDYIPSCYYFRNEFPHGNKISVTTQYYYGNYDRKNKPPTFLVKYDQNPLHTITTSSSGVVKYSLTYKVQPYPEEFWPYVMVCFAGGDYNDVPFVNTIQIEEAGNDNSKIVKIVVPIVVIVFVIIVVLVIVSIILYKKRRMALAHTPQGQPRQYNPNPADAPGQVAMKPNFA